MPDFTSVISAGFSNRDEEAAERSGGAPIRTRDRRPRGADGEASSDEMDQIQCFSEREYAMNHLERNSKRLREAKAALRRMDEGTFGVCSDCEEKIGLKRL